MSQPINKQDRNRVKQVYGLKVRDDSEGYTGAARYWVDADGVNPPTFAAIRLVDQETGELYDITVEGGSLTASLVLT